MSMKPEGQTAQIIPFPARRARNTARDRMVAPKSKSDTMKANALLAAAETCWYHGEAVAETRVKR